MNPCFRPTHVTSDLAYVRWHGRGERPWFNYVVTPHGDTALRWVSFYRTHARAPDEAGTLETGTGSVGAKTAEDLLLNLGDPHMLEKRRQYLTMIFHSERTASEGLLHTSLIRRL